jgi:pyruvate kinase
MGAVTDPKTFSAAPDPSSLDGHSHTKIVATIGPASEGRLTEMVEAGMSVARLNLSHGVDDDHRRRAAAIRAVSTSLDVPIGILADIPGPKMRLGRFPGGRLTVEVGETYLLTQGSGRSPAGTLHFDFGSFQSALEEGHRVLLADGAVELRIIERTPTGARAEVTRAGEIGDRKGVHLPDTPIELDVPTKEDLRLLELVNELDLDMVGVSFVATADELRAVRAAAPNALMVAKIERAAALENLQAILEEADGVMIARGDLGVEVELEQLPMVQKSLLQSALRAGKFTITATEMLESMISQTRPTRAEVADVATAVFDGTDAVMLSAETAVGESPVEAVRAMNRIALAVETSQRYADLPRIGFRAGEPTFSNATALAAAQAAEALSLNRIVCFTETGNTVRLISRYRSHAEIIAMSPHPRTLSAVAVLANVRPLFVPHLVSLEDMLETACRILLERGLALDGEEIVLVAGVPAGVARSTNVMKLHRIGEPIKLA